MAYRGATLTLPIGLRGFNGARNPSKLDPAQLSYTEGLDIDGGVLVKEGGALKLNAVAVGAPSRILSGTNWSPVPGNQHDIIALADGSYKKDIGAGTFPTTIASGLSVPTLFPPHFCVGGGEASGSTRKLFVCSEAHQMKCLPGTTDVLASITTPTADWASAFPIFAVQHAGRIWAGGNANEPHRIYYSQSGDHQNFTGAGSGQFSVYPGEGDQIVGGLSFRGLLILFKYPKGIYIIDSRDPTAANWQVQKLNGAVGAASPHCVVQVSNDVLVLDPFGNFHIMSTITDFGDINTSNIGIPSDIGTFMRTNVNLTNLRKAMGVWYGARAKAWFEVPQSGAVNNNMRIVVDLSDSQNGPRFLLSRRDDASALWMRRDGLGQDRPATGDGLGFVRTMDEAARNLDGNAYTMEFDTADNDFSSFDPTLGPKTKNGQFIEVVADLTRNTTVNIIPYWDGLAADPIALTLGSSAAALGSFVLDSSTLGSSGIVTARQKLTGQGRRLRLNVKNAVADDEVRISEIRVGVTIADERIHGIV